MLCWSPLARTCATSPASRAATANLLVLANKSILFTDPRYTIQAGQESTCQVRIAKGPLLVDVVAAISKLGLKHVGYEPARMSCDAFDSLKSKLPMKASLVAVAGWIEELRMIKSASEIDRIRLSVETNSRAFEQTVGRVRPGMKEQDLAAELEYRMRKLGAEKPSFETIVAGGARSALTPCPTHSRAFPDWRTDCSGHGRPTGGYCSDMTRMLFLGTPTAKVKRTYRAVLEAQLAGIDAVRAGVRTAAVDAACRKVLKGYGLDRAFVHSTGHGLGLEIHEPPRLGKLDKNRLKTGMAITIEPGVYLEGFGGIRIEDTVIVTAKGCDILTPTAKDLRVI